MMSPLKRSLVAFLGATLVTAGAFYTVVRLRAREVAELRVRNRALAAEIVARSDQRAKATAEPRAAVVAPATAVGSTSNEGPGDAMPSYYRNEGQATPVATLQTIAWACDRGDVETVATLLTFQGDGRAKVDEFLRTLPESTRAQWSTPELAAATFCLSGYMRRPYPAAVFLALADTEPIDASTMRLRLPDTPLDGGLYKKTDDGWKFMISEADVEKQLALYAARKVR